jgi:glucose/arabinose dehydrogenase
MKRLIDSVLNVFNHKHENIFNHQSLQCETLEDRMMLSTVQLIAAGQEGGENIQLQIDGVEVQSWTLNSGANTGQFQTLSYSTPQVLSADQIRVALTNDLYDPANDIDRNVRLDAILIDGQRFETEDPSVFSTGTWLPADGVQPGFRQDEYLHSNGYLQFANTNNGSTIQIRARGSEGGEQFNLLIDQQVAGTYSVTTSDQTFSYTAADQVNADQVRIEFLNDAYDPAAGIDNNLIVDFISIDGTTFQTEASTTFSTGTWLPADGIQPGFRQSEFLHSNGYFEFLAGSTSTGFIGLGDTQVTVDEDAGTVQIEVVRTDGSDGVAAAFYQTLGVEATDGQDFLGTANGQVNFTDGQTSGFITIQLVNDNALEDSETFSVSLFRAEGAELGVPRTAIVTIVDDESGVGLVAHWRLDESAIGATVVDSSGNGNNGNHQSIQAPQGPNSDTPDVDSANPRGLEFDGVDDFVSIAADPSLDLSDGNFTQSVWIKPEHTDNGYHGVLGFQGAGTANRYPGIWVYQQNRIHFGFGDGNNWNSKTTGGVLTPGEWNHVATTFDGTTYTAYVNGRNVLTTTDFAGRTPAATTQVNIGRVDSYFQGHIDDVRIYNRTLSATEIEVLIDGATLPGIPINGEFVANNLVSGFDTPIEVEWLPDGRMLVAEQDGLVRVVNTDGTIQGTPLLDIRSIVNAGTKDRGMIGFAVHPDFDNNPYIYAAYTYDPPEVNSRTGLGGPDGNGARVARISRFTVNAAGTFADPSSNVVLVGNNSTYANIGSPNIRPGLNDDHSCIDASGNPIEDCIAADETSHTIGELEFGPDGMLYAASGDGGSFGRVDPINLRSLDLDSLQGKILRIDPITGQGPSDNPFYDGDPDSNQSKVFTYGLRNPFRFDVAGTAAQPIVYVGDVGWTQWEEINAGIGGENFGWPAFEGGNGTSLETGGYRDLAEVQDYYATNPDVEAPIWARLHSDGARAIVMGDTVSSAYGGAYEGSLIFTDIGDTTLRAVNFDSAGNVSNVEIVSQSLGFIVDIQTGPDGLLYYVDITGSIGRLDFVIA